MFGGKLLNFIGTVIDSEDKPLFPIGLSKVVTDGYLTIAYVRGKETLHMFCLDPGIHRVRRPENVVVLIQTDARTKWSVKWPGRFDISDPTRIEAGMVRPRSPQQEQADYMNELAARASSREVANMLRSGKAEFDPSQENWDDIVDGEDMEAPYSVHQLNIIVDELQKDIKRMQVKPSPAKPSPSVVDSAMIPDVVVPKGKVNKSGKDMAGDQGDDE